MNIRWAYLAIALATLLAPLPANALVEQLTINNDPRNAFHIESFGYEAGGEFSFTMDDFVLMILSDYKKPPKFNIAFILQRSSSEPMMRIYDTASNSCFHETKLNEDDIIISLENRQDWKHIEFKHQILIPGVYHFYFSNCEFGTHASFKLRLEEYNIDASGAKIYLTAGEASLPKWFSVICLLFLAELIAWGLYQWKNKADIKSIHHLMTAVLALKIITLFLESLKYHSIKYHGTHDGWSIAFHIFSFLKGMMLLSVIVLIGTGWSYLKPFLTDRDKQIMLAVLVVQLMVNIAMVVVDETLPGSEGWLTWKDALHLLDMVCWCGILVPIVASIRHLKVAANTDGKVQRNVSRLQSFRTFYMLTVAYIYFTRIIVFLLDVTLPFEMTWLSYVFGEAVTLLFYGVTGYLFRPQPRNPYFPVEQDGAGDDDGVPSATTEMTEL